MPKKIEWLYDRKHCMTCQKARCFLEEVEGKVGETINATKDRRGTEEALELTKKVNRIVAMKGKKVVVFDLKKDPPNDETLLAHLMGPTGNLRAPTAIVGKTLLVGFNEEAYRTELGVE